MQRLGGNYSASPIFADGRRVLPQRGRHGHRAGARTRVPRPRAQHARRMPRSRPSRCRTDPFSSVATRISIGSRNEVGQGLGSRLRLLRFGPALAAARACAQTRLGADVRRDLRDGAGSELSWRSCRAKPRRKRRRLARGKAFARARVFLPDPPDIASLDLTRARDGRPSIPVGRAAHLPFRS